MMKKCSVVLADEPTGSLDKNNRDIVMRLFHELNEEGKTVNIVTHDTFIFDAFKSERSRMTPLSNDS